MYTRSWQIIRDDSKRTFEVLGQESNSDHFNNLVHGMQKLGMQVTAMLLPVTNQYASKDAIKYTGYVTEVGLYDRLMKDYRSRITEGSGAWDE
jgi:hypothetical protein